MMNNDDSRPDFMQKAVVPADGEGHYRGHGAAPGDDTGGHGFDGGEAAPDSSEDVQGHGHHMITSDSGEDDTEGHGRHI